VANGHGPSNGLAKNVNDRLKASNGRVRATDGWPQPPVQIAVVGLGYWGPNLVRNLHEAEEAEVAYICDRRVDVLQAVGRRYPAVAQTTEFAEVMEDAAVDAIMIATPVGTHFALAAAALEAGKHVFVEKPLAASSLEAEQLISMAEDRSLVLMPGHTFLYSPPVNFVKDLIDSGELGDIYFISSSRVNLGLHQPDVSVVWDLGPHDFSILLYWLDESPSQVAAMSRECIIPHIPDVAFLNLAFPSQVVAHIELSWLAPSKLRRTAIVGSQKMVVYDDTSNEPVRLFDSGVDLPDPGTFGEYRMTYRTGDILSPRVAAAEPLLVEIRDFCSAIRTGSVPKSSAGLGLEVVRVIEAVDESLAQNGVPVALDAGSLAFA
jgi:predicted dehydrogenase